MLCPETWRFTPPKSNYKEHKSNFLSANLQADNNNKKPSVLFDFNYGHLISIVLPNINNEETQTKLKEILSDDCDYYKIEDILLSTFLSREFIEKFVKSGELSALSINTKLDLDNCVCIKNGILYLHLDKVTYEGLGLEGKQSHFTNKYIVQVNLTATKITDRMRKCLEERLNKFTLILTWDPPESDICPSSIAKYLSDCGYGVYLCQPKHRTRNSENIKVPVFPSNQDDRNGDEFGAELIEWLGMFSLDADLTTGKYDNYINTYEIPDEYCSCENVVYLEWRGFYGAQKIVQLYEYLKTILLTTKSPWVSLYVQGFSDAPVAWNSIENHFFTNAENAYALFLKPDGNYLICTQTCSNKKHK